MSEELLQAFLRTDFYSFVQRVFRELNGGEIFVPGWQVEAICHALQEVAAGKRRRQIVCIPPRSLKSIAASVALPAWILGHDPTARIIAVSYSQELADRFSADCRQVMKSQWYRDLFPRTVISPFKDSQSYFRTTAGGFRDCTSIGGTLTGKGGSIIIVDDPAKPGEIMSKVQREAVNRWYGQTLISRLDNKMTGRILIIMQRLHLEDLVGYVQPLDDWETLTLPAIAEADEFIILSDKRVHYRRKGEVLRPDSEPREVLDRTREAMGSFAFSAQYQQCPIPSEGELIKRAWFRSYGIAPDLDHVKIVQTWDTATKIDGTNDYSVCITAAVMREEVYILDVFRRRLDFPSLKRAVVEQAHRFKAEVILIEDKMAGTSLIQQLNEDKDLGKLRPTPFFPKDDKVTRLATVSPKIEAGYVYLPGQADWMKAFLDELLQFPEGAHDNQVDAFSQLLAWNHERLHRSGKIVRHNMFTGKPM